MHDAEMGIELRDVSKRYRLYPGKLEMFMDVTGFGRLLGKRRTYPEHEALKNVTLRVPRGSRLGVIGRNGAGKTTLLKLITSNYQPSSGSVTVNGAVQALMTTGLGFHPELTGAQNIKASLIYNGLQPEQIEAAFEEIVDFVELEEYLHQPFKTYSLGMQARLGFATATAVKPDILIVDEVMGAGDAYFAAKSAERMQALTSGGLTLLLVSHSMAQIVQFCQRAIWLDRGTIVLEGEALEVVKAYEKYIRELDEARIRKKNSGTEERLKLERSDDSATSPLADKQEGAQDAEPAERAVSKWPGVKGLTLDAFRILGADGQPRGVHNMGDTLTYEVSIRNPDGMPVECTVAINTYTLDGREVLRDWSRAFIVPPEGARTELRYSPLLIGNGEYVVSIALFKTLNMLDTSTAIYFDLWDRSFQFKVVTGYPLDPSLVKAPSEWQIRDATGDSQPLARPRT